MNSMWNINRKLYRQSDL